MGWAYLGKLPSNIKHIKIIINSDGTFSKWDFKNIPLYKIILLNIS